VTSYRYVLEVNLQADSMEEARELEEKATALIATSVATGPSVLSVHVYPPRELSEREASA
jgi:hypothetical protein